MHHMDNLAYTSERVNPSWYGGTANEYLIYLFHVATYRFAQRFAVDCHVLDYGCGTGYGANMLAETANSVVGIDKTEDVIQHAKVNYEQTNLTFERTKPAEESSLSFGEDTFDLVVSSQVIEHVLDVDAFFSEIRRVLRPGGRVVIATPNRATRLFWFQQPWNRHHVTEFSQDGLQQAMTQHYSKVEVLGMTGEQDILAMELRRTNRMCWLSLPFTLPFMPDRFRQVGLQTAKRCIEKFRRRQRGERRTFEFDESAIVIGEYNAGCVNLVALGQ
jgi:2-polyprenyl-3-methyl-5-hydroxy-6-metoxy-1,4-benzoquinol methylase